MGGYMYLFPPGPLTVPGGGSDGIGLPSLDLTGRRLRRDAVQH